MKKPTRSIIFLMSLITILGSASFAKACTFTLTNNSSNRVWITNKNIGQVVNERQIHNNPTIQKLRINVGEHGEFGPNITQFFVYLSQGNGYTLAREVKTSRCGKTNENELTIRNIFYPNLLWAKQRGRFTIKKYSNVSPEPWLFESPQNNKFDI